MTDLTIDQQKLAHAIRDLAKNPADRAVRTRVRDCGYRLTHDEILEVFDDVGDAVRRAAKL